MSQRQLAAILFTDVVGYTAIMAEDEARAMLIRLRYRQVIEEQHEKFSGEVVNELGDGTLSLFPSAVEAVRCGIDIQQAFQEEPKIPLRIGVHFGDVVRDDLGLYGSAVNIASRLESMGTPGSILVSDRVRRELRNQKDLSFHSLGMFKLKNVPDPMEVYAVANTGIHIPKPQDLDAEGRMHQSLSVKGPSRMENFVGRENELEVLRLAWIQALKGAGSMIGIAGEPGIGKTTLVEDFLFEINQAPNPVAIARGRCSERLIGTEAYLPFLEMLQELITHESRAALLKQLAPAWYVQLQPHSINESEVLEVASRATQERRKRELLTYLWTLVQSDPLILFIDDWQWADTSSVDLVAYLAPRISVQSLLVLFTYRPADMKQLDHPFLKIQSGLIAKRLFQEIQLPFLKSEEISRYLYLKYPINNFSIDFAKRLQMRTEGSPLFMADLVEDLEERGLIYRENGSWQIRYQEVEVENTLPASINSMIQRKIDLLVDRDRSLLSLAAVQGYNLKLLHWQLSFHRMWWTLRINCVSWRAIRGW